MRISDLGEFGLIQRLRERLGASGTGVLRGIGDDTAVCRVPADRELLATCDALVEGVHFLRERATPRQIGRKAAAVNLSDIAAMGGEPAWMLVSLGLPRDTPVEFVEELYAGLAEEAGKYGAAVVGGNMAGLPERVFIDVFFMGLAPSGQAFARGGGGPGQVVLVTGTPGDSAAGLTLLDNPEAAVPPEVRARLVARHLVPTPRVAEGLALMRAGVVRAAVDVSDGLVADLGHILEESGCGASLLADRLPVSEDCALAAAVLGKDPRDLALNGGEDYELLFTVDEADVGAALAVLEEAGGAGATVIGVLEEGGGVRVTGDGAWEMGPGPGGWSHFR